MRTTVYIDGFNLYYRRLKARPSKKWLNPKALAEQLLRPPHVISQVNYYTARLSARANDPDAPARQAIYLNALAPARRHPPRNRAPSIRPSRNVRLDA